MTVDVLKGTERDAVDLGRLLGEWRQGTFRRTASQVVDEPRRGRSMRWGYGCLLQNLNTYSVGVAWELEVDTDSYILDVAVLGYPDVRSGGSFELQVDGITREVPFEATAEEFQDITRVTGQVTLGAFLTTSEQGQSIRRVPARWRIQYSSVDAAELITSSQGAEEFFCAVTQTNMVGTGATLEVIQPIPAGWTSPCRTGAIGGGPIVNSRLEINSLEPRYWFPRSSGNSSYY